MDLKDEPRQEVNEQKNLKLQLVGARFFNYMFVLEDGRSGCGGRRAKNTR